MIENNAPVPHTALASVNQSARWNSRIIWNGFFLPGVVVVSMLIAGSHAGLRARLMVAVRRWCSFSREAGGLDRPLPALEMRRLQGGELVAAAVGGHQAERDGALDHVGLRERLGHRTRDALDHVARHAGGAIEAEEGIGRHR